MTLNELIHRHHWMSIETELLRLYPDQDQQKDAYRDVFDQLKLITPEPSEIIIRIKEIIDDDEAYVDVNGYYAEGKVDGRSGNDALALDFKPWNQWLDMTVDRQAFEDFTELEIIAHCLYEMTFISFDQDEIEEQLEDLKKTMEEYDNMTPEERKKNTISLDDFLKNMDEDDEE